MRFEGFERLDDGYTWLPFEFDGTQITVDPAMLDLTLKQIARFVAAMQARYDIPPLVPS